MAKCFRMEGVTEDKSDSLNIHSRFGGHPNWVEVPTWPISREWGLPMQFICQIKLNEDLFPGAEGRMAYIFMTDDLDSGEHIDGTYDPALGENAVIIQPGGILPGVECKNIITGPTISENEHYIKGVFTEEPDFLSEYGSPEADEEYYENLHECKLGGTPYFIQGEETPDDYEWRFLMQFNNDVYSEYGLDMNLGDSGTAYAFLSKDYRQGTFLWQCF